MKLQRYTVMIPGHDDNDLQADVYIASEALDWFLSQLKPKQRLCHCGKCYHCIAVEATDAEHELLRAIIEAERNKI